MKQKKNDPSDKAELIEDPTKYYDKLVKIEEEMSNLQSLEKDLSNFITNIETELANKTSHDPELRNSDTIDCIKIYFKKVQEKIENTYVKLTSTVREKLYYIIYNIIILFLNYIEKMRKYNYSLHGIEFVEWLITLMESNIVLSHIKYMKLRTQLYLLICFLYEDCKGFKAAFGFITKGINKLLELKSIEEQQRPLPDYMQDIFDENLKHLRYFEFKYGIISGNLNFESWKKKLEETYDVNMSDKNDKNAENKEKDKNKIAENILNRNICAINSISNLSFYNSIVNHEGTKYDWKNNMINYIYTTLFKPDIDNIKNGIIEFIDKKKRDLELSSKITQNEKNYDEILNEAINTNTEKEVRNYEHSSKVVPLELHVELLKACYDNKLFKEFMELIDSINTRIKYRHVEHPYISDVDIQMSSIQYANIPNGYEKIPLDLNINNYKREIKKLREAGKYISNMDKENSQLASLVAKGNKKDKKKDAKKDAKKDPKKDAAQKKPEKKINEENAVPNPYEKIENLEHNFVYLLLRRSHNPNKALTNIRIVMSNDYKIKKDIKPNERAIALPVKIFKDNLYEKEQKIVLGEQSTKFFPYIIITKGSSQDLSDDNEKLNAIVDVFPLISNCPYATPKMNYVKIEPEITIQGKNSDPNYISYNFSHFYVNLTYLNDKSFYMIEREVEILRHLFELENSCLDNKDKIENPSEENNSKEDYTGRQYQFLKLNYNFEKLDLLATWIYNSIQDECGNYFLNMRSNFLYDICILIYKKYLKNFLERIDYFNSFKDELEQNLVNEISQIINSLFSQIFNTLFCIHYVLTNIPHKDVIIYGYISLLLGDYAEKTGNNATGVVVLKDTIEFIEKAKEKEDIFGIDNRENKQTFTSFTCDNNKIYKLKEEIDGKYYDYVKKINKKRRVNYRMINEQGISKADPDIINEEDFEVNYVENEYNEYLEKKDKKLYDGNKIYLNDEKNKDNIKVNYSITEYENDLNCIYIELIMKYYRMYIKSGEGILDKIKMYENLKKNKNNLETKKLKKNTLPHINLPERITKKLDIIKGESAVHVKNNMNDLKKILQEGGKLQPDKPILSKSEKVMKLNINKNSYLMALYNASLASMRPKNKQDQIYLLTISNNNIDQVIKEEDERYNYYSKYFFYIKSLERFNANTNELSYHYYPYNLLYKPIMVDKYEKIPEPILIHKTSKNCSFIFPLVKIKKDQLDKVHHNISKVKMFGQISTGSNIVQLNNTSLTNTNKIIPIIDSITIQNLKNNEKYIFAYAAFDNDETMVNTIGSTSKEVELYFPLPIHYISYHVCKVAFEFKFYNICKERSKIVFNYFTEKSDIKEIKLDNKNNSIILNKLKYDYVYRTSLFELEGVAYCFYYLAKSTYNLKLNEHLIDNKVESNVYKQQKNVLKILNILNLGLEIAIYLRNYKLIKMFVIELYNTSVQIINKENLYKELLNIYMKMSLGVNIIPNDIWDINLRKISSLIVYNIFILGNMINEPDIVKKSLIMDLGLKNKKYYPFKYTYLQKEEEVIEQKDKKDKGKAKPQENKKEENKVEENPNEKPPEPKFKEISNSVLKDLEKECQEIIEFIYSCGDYNELVKAKLDIYKDILDTLIEKYNGEINNVNAKDKKDAKNPVEVEPNKEFYPNLQSEIDKHKLDINDLIEVWDGFKTEGIKYVQKYITSGISKNNYYQFLDKMLKKLIQNFIGGLYSTGGSSDAKKDKAPAQGAPSNFGEILSTIDAFQVQKEDNEFILNIFEQKLQFISGDILYKLKVRIRDSLANIKQEMEKKKNKMEIDLEKMGGDIEEKFFGCIVQEEIKPPYDTLNENDILKIKEKLYWISDLYYNKGIILYLDFLQSNHVEFMNYDFNNFFNFRLCDIKKLDKYGEKNDKEIDDLKLLDIKLGFFNQKEKKAEEKKLEQEPGQIPEGEKPVSRTGKKEDNKKKPLPKKDDKKKKDVKGKEAEEENIDPNDDILDRNIAERYQKLNKIFEQFALCALCNNDTENYSHLDNLIYFIYNIIIYDMLSPYNCCDDIIIKNEDEDSETNPYKSLPNNIWSYLIIIGEVALVRLNQLKKGSQNFTEFDYDYELNKFRALITENKFNAPIEKFHSLSKSLKPVKNKLDEENLLDSYSRHINIDIYIELLTFIMQCAYYKQRWSVLSEFITKFNDVTNELFSQFTLAFLIEGQKHIFEKANSNTQNKQEEINKRVEVYETWKNSRKKNKRQQMITGEIPPEQLEFEKDYAILSNELSIYTSISDMLKNDKEKSEKLYESFLNDTNNALKAVQTCRKKYEEYQIELMSLEKYKYNFGINYSNFINKFKNLQFLQSNMLIGYKNCIQVLKKRQENYLLIQILYEMSLVLYSMHTEKTLRQAEVFFNEEIDTVFQKLYSVKGFRDIKFENYINASGSKNIYVLPSFLYAIKSLHKLSKYCYDNSLYDQLESALFASKITFYVLNNIIPNPSIYSAYGIYRLNDINENINIFDSKFNIKPGDLLVSLIELSQILISYNKFEECLPMLCLAEYLACDKCKNINYTLFSRILKIICLAEIGYINEAFMNYYKIIKKYDLPQILSSGYKVYSTGKYANLTHNEDKVNYFNNLPPDDEKNINALNTLIKLTIDNDLKSFLGPNLYYYLQYSKLIILFKVTNKDNYNLYPDKNNFSNLRDETFIRIEKECRENIAILSTYEDINFLMNCMKSIKYNELNYKDNIIILQNKLNEIIDANKITSDEIKNFITLKYNKPDIELSKERYELIFKFRILLSQLYICQGLYINSSMIIYKSIENFNKLLSNEYGNKIFNFDNGEDFIPDLKPNEISIGGGGAKGGKPPAKQDKKDAKPVKKDDKKGKKDNKDLQENAPNVDPELQIKELMKIIAEKIYKNQRIIPNSVYWFKLHLYHLTNLYKMNRFKDCLYIINKIIKNSQKINDTYFFIRAKEIEIMIYVQQYDIMKAQKSYDEILQRGKTNFINDYELCVFYGNFAEYQFIEKNYELALNLIKFARNILWEKYASFNYLIQPQTIFSEKNINNLYIDKEMMNKLIDKETNISAKIGNAKKDPKSGGGDNSGQLLIDYFSTEQIFENPNYDKDNYSIPKIEYQKDTFENIYYKYTELICKIDLKYVYFQICNPQKNNEINIQLCESILKDLLIMFDKLLYQHTYYKTLTYYLIGMLHKIKFVKYLKAFLQKNFLENQKLLKKNNLEVLTLDKIILFKYCHYFNEACNKQFLPTLKQAKENFKKALDFCKNDFFIFENSFSVLDITSQLADISILLAEYKMHQNLKYADINQVVVKINSLMNRQIFYDKPNDDLQYLKEENLDQDMKDLIKQFKEDKNKKDKNEYVNYIKQYIYYSDLSIKIKEIKKTIIENTHELCTGISLIDVSKLPKDITLQILESDYITKKNNKDFVQNIAIKTSIDSFDVINLLKNYMKEIDYFNFNQTLDDSLDEKLKNLTKLHKFLKTNLSSYQSKCCIEFTPQQDDDTLTSIDFITNDQINVSYALLPYETISHLSGLNGDFNQKNGDKYINLIYLLGNNSKSAIPQENAPVKPEPVKPKAPAKSTRKKKNDKKEAKPTEEANSDGGRENIIYGRIMISEKFLMNLNQRIYNLKTQCRMSMTLSEEKKKRDFKYYQIDYYNLIYDFIKEIFFGKKQFNEVKKIKDVIKEEDIGEVSVDNLEFWFNFCNFSFYKTTNTKFNELLRKIHKTLIN